MLKRILVCVLVFLVPGVAVAACGSIPASYPVLSGNKLEIGKDSTVNNGTSTSNIYGGAKYDGTLDAIDPGNGAVISVSSSYPSLDPATFPGTGSTDTSAATVVAGSYDDVSVANSATTSFSGGSYYIDKLDIGKSATANLAAGSYFIDTLSLGNGAKILVSSGTVRLYIGSDATLDKSTLINAAGAVADLQVFLYPGADWDAANNVTFVGIVYAPGTSSKIEFGKDASIQGALVTAGEVKLGQDANLIFSAADQAAAGGVSTCAASAAPGSFNAFETATAAGATSGVIKTKIAGTAFGLHVVAISSGAQASTFSNAVKVELLGNATTGVGLDANNCPTSFTLLQTIASANIANGRSAVSFAAVSNAWRDVRVRISYPTSSPTSTSCSTDNFAIRPASLAVSAHDNDWQSPGINRTLANMTASGGNVHKAGQPFTLHATGLNASNSPTGNYTGSPTLKTLACTLPAAPSTCINGILTPGVWSGSGTVTSSSASYSEAGSFSLTLEDQTFANVDSADSTLLERTIPQAAAVAVGRFVPDHFEMTTASTPVFKTFNDTICATRSFTYVGQPFGYVTLPEATITAQNAAGATTLNYTGALWKLVPAGSVQSHTPVTGVLDIGLLGAPTVTATGSGVGTLKANAADEIAFVRTNPVPPLTPPVPFPADISLTMSIQDIAEAGVSGNGTIDTLTPALFANIAFDAGNEIRFGLLALFNAHGSELLNLPVPIETRYWNGSGFTRNTADFCTQLAAAHVALSGWKRDLNACETSVSLSGRFNAGRGNLRFSAPGAGNTGSVDLTLQLGVTASGSGCVAGGATSAVAASQSWLQGRGSGVTYDQDPAARASFGLYRGSKSLIYLREMY